MVERAFEIAKSDVGIYGQTLDLMKQWRVTGVWRVMAMDFSRADDANGRRILLHTANLHWRSVGSQ